MFLLLGRFVQPFEVVDVAAAPGVLGTAVDEDGPAFARHEVVNVHGLDDVPTL
jgi:hypothetical protein